MLGARQGLFATHTSGLGFDRQSGDIVYAGTDQGIYRSADAGETFKQVPDRGYVTDIEFGTTDPATGYAAWHPDFDMARGTVYRTSDRGLTWSRVSVNLPDGLWIVKLIVDPRRIYEVDLAIYDVSARLVRTLVGGRQNAGEHTVSWDGRDARGQPVASGIYLYRLFAGGHVQVRRMVLLR